MRKMLPALLLLLPGPAIAGPPEVVSGRMVLDKVADGLRHYRAALTPEARVVWLGKLAPTADPRVAVALGEAMSAPDEEEARVAALLLARHRFSFPGPMTKRDVVIRVIEDEEIRTAAEWWQRHEADLRRRAKELPR